jgi:hypothetical protein
MMIINQRLSPRMLDAILATRAGFSPQMTDEPRSEDDPDNLYAPIGGARHGQEWFPGAFLESLQLAADASDGEARCCGSHGAGTVDCLARKVIEPARGSP